MAKKTIIGIVILLVVIAAVFFFTKNSQPQVEYITQTVSKGTLKQSVDATGKIESADKIDLNFKITGRLSQLSVKPGDNVTADQVLARLETQGLQSKVTDASAKLAQEKADYEKLLAGASTADIQVAQDTVGQKSKALSAAQSDLTNLIITKDTELANLKDAAITDIGNELVTAQRALDEITDVLNEEGVESNLTAHGSSLLASAKNNQTSAQVELDSISLSSSTLNTNSANLYVENDLDRTKNMLGVVATALSDTLGVLNAALTSSNLTAATLKTLKDDIRAQQTLISTSQNTIQTAKAGWTNKIVYFIDQEALHQDAIEDAVSALQIAESQLVLKKSPPRQFEIDAAQAEVNRAQALLSLAMADLNDAIIVAPLAGTITKKNYEKGEQTSLTMPILEMIGQSKLQIEVDIPESDIAKVFKEQSVNITLDAFGDDEIFSGQVIFIDPAETVIQDVVYYKVKVELTDQDERKKPGMTANVTILSNVREDVLSVPSRAIKGNGDKYVEVLVNGVVIKKDVTTGLRGDLGTEIISGIKEGDEVITFVKEN
jgi:HlyD family secretion protein